MPIKVRCKGCEKVLSAPDKARGKVLKCPKCGERIRVPASSEKKPTSKRSSAKKKRPAKKKKTDADGLDFLAKIDLSDDRRVEDRHVSICPKCAVEVDEEDEVCENCGVVIATGQLSDKEKRRRDNRGPDPTEFYPLAWSDPWQFLIANRKLVFRTVMYWTFFGTLFFLCLSMATRYCTRVPPMFFWGGLASLPLLGITGWYFIVQMDVIKMTFAKKKTLKKIKFDAFVSISLGMKLLFWPFILMLPFILFPPVWLLPSLVFPIAMTHFAMKYTYKAFLPVNMTRIFFKTLKASLYYQLIVTAIGILNIIVLVLFLFFASDIIFWIFELIPKAALLVVDFNRDSPGFVGSIVYMCAAILIQGTLAFIFALFSAPVAIYVMRLVGLFGYYNQESLELVRYVPDNGKAPFGARYIAFLVDRLMGGIAWGAVFVFLSVLVLLFNQMEEKELGIYDQVVRYIIALQIPIGVASFVFLGFIYKYYITSVVGPSQATLGKHALGLYVCDKKGKRLKKGLAWKRFFYRSLLGTFTLGISHIVAAFNEEEQTMHDKMTETQVLWKGDDERS